MRLADGASCAISLGYGTAPAQLPLGCVRYLTDRDQPTEEKSSNKGRVHAVVREGRCYERGRGGGEERARTVGWPRRQKPATGTRSVERMRCCLCIFLTVDG